MPATSDGRPSVSTLRVPTAPQRQESLQIVVIAGGVADAHPLPGEGDLVIGRSAECSLQVDDPSLSRRHAVLHIGPPMTVEDLGSANGTRVRDRALPPRSPAPVEVGEVIDLGATMVVVQRHVPVSAPPLRRVWSHGYFEGRVEEECARAEDGQSAFSLLHVRCEAAVPAGLMEDVVFRCLRRADVVGRYAPGEIEVLVVGATMEEAAAVARRLESELADQGARPRVGSARYPIDGRTPWALEARAAGRGRAEGEEPQGAVVEDPAMRSLYALVRRVAPGNITVLVTGETGVGKELVAEEIHRQSSRAGRPLLRLHCAALSETLLESELFGHERGAFTGAQQAKAGLLETADGGTVLLDEVGELPASVQVKLLRVLEDRQVLRVGSLKPRPLDVRFVSATNRDLEAEIARGAFRQDLYFRIAGITLHVPPLRERPDEIEPIVRAFVARAAREAGLPNEPAIDSEVLAVLSAYPWPGNIRELRNVVERAVLLCGDGELRVEHLPAEKMMATISERTAAEPPSDAAPAAPLRAGIAALEKQAIEDALRRGGGNQTEAARILGISRRTLASRLDAFGIPRPRKG